MTTRRAFIQALGAAGAAALVAPRSARAADSRIDILIDEPIGPIAPELYGHFAEHLGGVVYDGIWVGDGSPVPNDGGIRTSIVERLKQIKAPVIRWPGGCFADSYDWRDGIGPRANRATRTNFWVNTKVPPSPSQYDPNSFGTVEFARFCKLAGAQPYLAANIRSLPARDLYQWIEFCNSPAGTTTLAGVRAAEGSPDPLNVVYWGVGNEPWGCGGDFSPEDYAVELKRYTAWVPSYDLHLRYIAAGANSGDVEWTRRFFDKLTAGNPGMAGRLWGFSFHHYAWNVSGGKTTDWNEGKGPAVGFTLEQHYELLRDADKMDGFITAHWQTMGQFDRARKVKLVVDEWGAWHKPGSESDPSHTLGQVSTLRDALLAGLTLDTFQRHADKVGMANIAQLVNCLQSLFVAHGSKVHRDAELPRVPDVHGSHGRRVGPHGIHGAARELPAQRTAGDVLGPRRVGVQTRQDGDADGREPERRRRARDDRVRARREDRERRHHDADGRRARRAQFVRRPGRGAGAEGEPGDAGRRRRSRRDVAQGVGE